MSLTRPALLICGLLLSACSTVQLPDVDLMGQSDFNDELANLEMTYPGTDEAPAIPSDVRSDSEWDRSAQEMLALGSGFNVPSLEPALSAREFDDEFSAGQSDAEAYKLDDPQ